ncbi:hypothetical protein ACTWPB_19740 [Nocardia sp. IBHARD005]|uniref:hypothetical protein n=1 Tax=Nocardia sp. IBHARD005 TaxID=3457765 RepID=UPI0040586454
MAQAKSVGGLAEPVGFARASRLGWLCSPWGFGIAGWGSGPKVPKQSCTNIVERRVPPLAGGHNQVVKAWPSSGRGSGFGDRSELMLTARTLAEATIYLSLVAASDEARHGPPETSLTEGTQAWTLHSELGDVAVRYQSEDVSRRLGRVYGLGVSQLIDAGQWIMISQTFARRALEADMAYTAQPGQDRTTVELNWEFAAETVVEAMKFLPEGAGRLPAEAFWSELGEQFAREQPDRITRAHLVDDYEYYTGTLEDFRQLYGEA